MNLLIEISKWENPMEKIDYQVKKPFRLRSRIYKAIEDEDFYKLFTTNL